MNLRIPGSTYRVQLHRDFDFTDLVEVLDYLEALGITDVYASPILAAAPGSRHGYDVVDPERLNPELGGEQGMAILARALKQQKMGLLLDVVPNHMCVVGGANRYWLDVLENGPGSPFARYFDIDWNPPKPDLADKVLLPILGDQYGNVLERQELKVKLKDGAFALHYFDSVLPLAPKSWTSILQEALAIMRRRSQHDLPGAALLESIVTGLGYLPAREELDLERVRERHREKEVIKARLAALVDESAVTGQAIEEALRDLQGTIGDPHSFDRLDAILSEQAYRLAFWRVASDEINYRRFFDINELAAVRVEDPEVFRVVHATILGLVRAGTVTGLRIDHVDGLYDPGAYLQALQDAAQDPAPATPVPRSLYVVVEKILAPGEHMPPEWPIDGTTGYDFLNVVGGVFVDRQGAQLLNEVYCDFSGRREPFEDLVYRCKKLTLEHSLSSQVAMLARRVDRISEQSRHSRDFTFQSLQFALEEVLARFPVYRTYVLPGGVASEADRRWIDEAVAAAVQANPAASASLFDFLRQLLVGEDPPGLSEEEVGERRELVLRLQQLTGAVMAKSVEDTAFYRYFPLASRGEVGGTPDQPGVSVEEFHQHNLDRWRTHPHSLLATSSHDTKRSEDVRARIRALSEIPELWQQALHEFREANGQHRTTIGGRAAPDRNEEYLIYQTLLGVWPLEAVDADGRRDLMHRVCAYLQKAVREAKINSSWLSPNRVWEQAVTRFVEQILTPGADNLFLEPFLGLQRRVAQLGIYGSLAQVLLRCTAPGVPDLYQGNELWDFSLVDPDNRRPVDYQRRRTLLAGLDLAAAQDRQALLGRLLGRVDDGRIKLYVTSQALRARGRNRGAFESGEYHPLASAGARAEQVLAFARTHGTQAVLVAVGRHFASLEAERRPPIGSATWAGTQLRLSGAVPPGTYRDAFSGLEIHLEVEGTLALDQAFQRLPIALLERVQ